MENQDIRARILQDMYDRKEKSEEMLTSAKEYASLLGIPESVANFNMEYLLNSGLVKGEAIPTPDSTKKMTMLFDITAHGVEAVEGFYGRDLAINFNNMTFNGPVEGSQIAAGNRINQNQSVPINEFEDLRQYIDAKLDMSRKEALKPLLDELESQIDRDSIRASTLRRISELTTTWGPVAIPIVDALAKLAGIKH